MSESVNFEKMDIAELEEYVQNHPYGDYYIYMHAWYVYACRLLDGKGCTKDPAKPWTISKRLPARAPQPHYKPDSAIIMESELLKI